MILYCDTSALVKIYIAEADQEQVLDSVDRANAVAVSRIAWAEFHAALARRAREVPGDAAELEKARKALASEWPSYVVVETDQPVVERAGEYAEAFALRAYDAVQLATASKLRDRTGEQTTFACYDHRLVKAAKILGLETLTS